MTLQNYLTSLFSQIDLFIYYEFIFLDDYSIIDRSIYWIEYSYFLMKTQSIMNKSIKLKYSLYKSLDVLKFDGFFFFLYS